MKSLLAAAVFLLAPAVPAAASPPARQTEPPPTPAAHLQAIPATTIVLELETPSGRGRIAVALYRDAASFHRSQGPVRSVMVGREGPATRPSVTRVAVRGLPPGQYAIAAFQDVDGDGRLGTGSFGVPSEPFGFSRDARARFGPPAFASAAFAVTLGETTQRIVLRNPLNALLR